MTTKKHEAEIIEKGSELLVRLSTKYCQALINEGKATLEKSLDIGLQLADFISWVRDRTTKGEL